MVTYYVTLVQKRKCVAANESTAVFLAIGSSKVGKLNKILDNQSYYFGYVIHGLVDI